jgi:hypothetical protein
MLLAVNPLAIVRLRPKTDLDETYGGCKNRFCVRIGGVYGHACVSPKSFGVHKRATNSRQRC